MVNYPKRSRLFPLNDSLKKLGKSLGRRNHASVANQAVKHSKIRKNVIERLGRLMASEMRSSCSIKNSSLLRNTTRNDMQAFKWVNVVKELKSTAPVTVSLLNECCKKMGRDRSRLSAFTLNSSMIIGLICAVLLRARNQNMNLIQKMISLVLYRGHASKQVCV